MTRILFARSAAFLCALGLGIALTPRAAAEPGTCHWKDLEVGSFAGAQCLASRKCGMPWENKNINVLSWRQYEVCCNGQNSSCTASGQRRMRYVEECGAPC